MEWYVDNKESFEERQKYIEKIMKEKQKQIEKLKFEASCLFFLHTTLKNNGWEKKSTTTV